MVKIKLNVKTSSSQEVPNNNISFFQPNENIKKVIPYEDEDEDINTEPVKIYLKPKIAIGSKIKINVKKNTNNNKNNEVGENKNKSFSIEPKIMIKNQTSQTVVKINVKNKKKIPKSYKSSILDQKPIKKINIQQPKLSGQIKLESFYDDGQSYFIDWESKYIFPPDLSAFKFPNDNCLSPMQPIGKLIESPWGPDDFKEHKIPLIKRSIEWFFYYPLDVDALS